MTFTRGLACPFIGVETRIGVPRSSSKVDHVGAPSLSDPSWARRTNIVPPGASHRSECLPPTGAAETLPATPQPSCVPCLDASREPEVRPQEERKKKNLRRAEAECTRPMWCNVWTRGLGRAPRARRGSQSAGADPQAMTRELPAKTRIQPEAKTSHYVYSQPALPGQCRNLISHGPCGTRTTEDSLSAEERNTYASIAAICLARLRAGRAPLYAEHRHL